MQKRSKFIQLIIALFMLSLSSAQLYAAEGKGNDSWTGLSNSKSPTIVTSKKVLLKSEQKFFVYTGDVKLVKEDFVLTSDRLEGNYNDKQGIEELRAYGNVIITKGPTVKTHSEKAVYDKATETMILTESPEIEQEGSVLTADVVRIYLKENRSVAEGNVSVKLKSK